MDDGQVTEVASAPLHGARIELRPITPEAAAELEYGGEGDGGFRWAEGGPYSGTRDAAGMLLRSYEVGLYREDWGTWAIVRLSDGLALGGIGFHAAPGPDRWVEIGYDLAWSARGRGYATEAARLLSAYALASDEVELVLAHTEPWNTASQAVLVRAGFVREGESAGLFRFARR